MEAWKDHFQNLLNADNTISNTDPITKFFHVLPEIKCRNFSQAEVNTALKQMINAHVLMLYLQSSGNYPK